MKDKTLMVIAVAVVLSVTAIVVASNMDLKIMSTSDFVLISPDDGSTFTGSPTFSFTVNKQTTNPVTELRVMSSDGAWTMEWSRTGDFTYTFSSLPDGNYTWYVILWSLSGSTYTRVGVSETRTFTISVDNYVSLVSPPDGAEIPVEIDENGYSSDTIYLIVNAYIPPEDVIFSPEVRIHIVCTGVNNWEKTTHHSWSSGYGNVTDSTFIEVGSLGTGEYHVNYGDTVEWWAELTDVSGSHVYDTTEHRTFTVVKSENQHYLSVRIIPSGGGNVYLNPSGGIYDSGTSVAITAIPYEGWAFDHWEGDVTGSSSSVTITMDSDKSITAYFVEIQPDQFTLTLASDPPEGGTITATPSGGTYDAGTPVTLTAIPNNGYAFKGWTGTSITDKSSLTTTVTINSDMTVTAHFEKTRVHLPWLFPIILILLIAGIGMLIYNERRK